MLPRDIPAFVVTAPVLVEVRLWGLVRRMRRTEGEVGQELPRRGGGLLGGDHRDRLIDQILRQVVAGFARRVHGVVVDDQLRRELVRGAAEESVEAVEASSQRPVVERSCGSAIGQIRKVPLAESEGRITVGGEHFGEGRRRRRDHTPAVREARVDVGQEPHADRVVVAAAQQARTSRRAQRCRMKVRVAETTGRQPIDVRGVDVAPVAAEVRESRVVEHDDHDVGSTVRRDRAWLPCGGQLGGCGSRTFAVSHRLRLAGVLLRRSLVRPPRATPPAARDGRGAAFKPRSDNP